MKQNESVQHTAVLREAQLAAGLIGSGATALGKANHAQVGYYHQAFFGLSIGVERLCKLLVIADYAIENHGKFPDISVLKRSGHDLDSLLNVCDAIGQRVDPSREFRERPQSAIHRAIIRVLTDFATSTRYYNLDFLTKPATSQMDPVAAWWVNVGEPICELHYSNASRRRDTAKTTAMAALLEDRSMVIFTAETGTPINTISAHMQQGHANRVVQKYGRLYTLQIVRWLVSIANHLSHAGAYEKRIAALLGFEEPFVMFFNDDTMLKSRKTWHLYR